MSIPDGARVCIREVWNRNARREFVLINKLKHCFSNISIDTEFPGCFPLYYGLFSEEEHAYQTLRANVDNLKLIQVGFTLTNEHGELPMIDGAYCAWQFNISDFNIDSDFYVESSICLLTESGIDFKRNRRDGIDSRRFGSFLMQFNLVCNPKLNYICYQGDYDFAYLLKLLTGEDMPITKLEFAWKIKAYFGTVCDIRDLQVRHFHIRSGLQKFSEELGLKRLSGTAHQAGSDSLLTSSAYHILQNGYSCMDPCKRKPHPSKSDSATAIFY
ncbi:hypothetical protein KP509_14G061800 [Ceratopteris richardii]|uniref:poly(A)-specific ribonuclease n=1 Tax=Ceratopteris richardii TaxID=49495 RepID=A0A8T2T8G3_CERRI|nr:hypothetical protein KP509_14G061500 [Ceratopteris richardii]KAH7415807.1 hypothetical protein KP509_14G061800 [Ceratopteris richardii]